jgi:hypothetical protein
MVDGSIFDGSMPLIIVPSGDAVRQNASKEYVALLASGGRTQSLDEARLRLFSRKRSKPLET